MNELQAQADFLLSRFKTIADIVAEFSKARDQGPDNAEDLIEVRKLSEFVSEIAKKWQEIQDVSFFAPDSIEKSKYERDLAFNLRAESLKKAREKWLADKDDDNLYPLTSVESLAIFYFLETGLVHKKAMEMLNYLQQLSNKDEKNLSVREQYLLMMFDVMCDYFNQDAISVMCTFLFLSKLRKSGIRNYLPDNDLVRVGAEYEFPELVLLEISRKLEIAGFKPSQIQRIINDNFLAEGFQSKAKALMLGVDPEEYRFSAELQRSQGRYLSINEQKIGPVATPRILNKLAQMFHESGTVDSPHFGYAEHQTFEGVSLDPSNTQLMIGRLTGILAGLEPPEGDGDELPFSSIGEYYPKFSRFRGEYWYFPMFRPRNPEDLISPRKKWGIAGVEFRNLPISFKESAKYKEVAIRVKRSRFHYDLANAVASVQRIVEGNPSELDKVRAAAYEALINSYYELLKKYGLTTLQEEKNFAINISAERPDILELLNKLNNREIDEAEYFDQIRNKLVATPYGRNVALLKSLSLRSPNLRAEMYSELIKFRSILRQTYDAEGDKLDLK